MALKKLNVTSLSQYVRLENCERFLRFRLCPSDEKALRKRWDITIQPLTPLLSESGTEFEQDVAEKIASRGEPVHQLEEEEVEATIERLHKARKPEILLQPWAVAPLGDYTCRGRADVVRLHRDRKRRLHILVVDIKASRHERMEHRLQVATYAHMFRTLAAQEDIPVARIEGAVLHIQEDGSIPSLDSDTAVFDLETYYTILDRLIVDEDAVVPRIAALPFQQVPYHLSYKCDGCLYNALCMYDSAERLDLSLVPYISAVEKRVLQDVGITTLPQLAALMDLPDWDKGEKELKVAPGQEKIVETLNNRWPVGPNLPLLVQRARRAMKRFDKGIAASTYIVNSGFGTLPSDEDHPKLVKIFFDAQRDYLQDRVYMISTLVKGPRGEEVVVHCTDGPPTEDSERDLLVDWVLDVLRGMRAVADGDKAPIHLYCYNRYDQRVLLEALKRHLDEVAAFPPFFDLMTQSAAVEQPIISFLSSEIEERRNLGPVCTPLHDVARMLGFDWQDDDYQYYVLFRARLFDNRRHVVREGDGRLVRVGGDIPRDDPRRIPIEAASRFNSQIPLEYAYGVWGCLPEDVKDKRVVLDPFRRVSLEQLEGFAAHRVRALAYIEDTFKYKARWLDKPDLHLPTLEHSAFENIPLRRSLEEFLFMEHHASLQAKLQVYGLPIDRRVQTGLALLLRCEGRGQQEDHYRFAIAFDEIGLDPTLAMNACRLKEGDWLVLNPADPPPSASQIKGGRLAIIQGIGPDWIELNPLSATFWHSRFRYPHDNKLEPQPGEYYTIDEMADDMNADKALSALHHADNNVLYQWLLERPGERPISGRATALPSRFADLIDQIEGRKKRLTSRQREVIAKRTGDPLYLVQGPPGTGKSHTLAWTVLARVALRAAQGKPCRIAVSCKTHNAVNIVLEAITAKLRRLLALPTRMTESLRDLRVYKIVNDLSDDIPDYVEPLWAYGFGKDKLEDLLNRDLIIIGGTPGGLYNLGKYRAAGGRKVNWDLKTFDVVVIDEASQMSLPEGILACSSLKPDGSAIIVGDHRQMPPIIAHEWETEEKRTATANQPYLSLFESLIEREFPCVALDESFRLHRTIAEFLRDNIYDRDGIPFFSKRREVLVQPPITNPYVDQALDPDYPIVVIEHGEQHSQQYNEMELELIRPLVDVCANRLRLDGRDGIGVVVPHRAQKAKLRESFPDLAVTESIDTVERFQGGERDVIIVSATASDPDYVLAEASFLLDPNRLNVAISRPRKKLIVVASRSVVDLLTSDLEIFDNAMIWKRLYYQYAADTLWQGRLNGVPVNLHGRRAN